MTGQRNHTRKETRDNLKQCSLALELARILKHFFPDLLLCFGNCPIPDTKAISPIRPRCF